MGGSVQRKALWILVTCWFLAACGGGSGSSESSAPAYFGSTNQAIVTASNARALSLDAYAGAEFTTSISGAAKEIPGDEAQASVVPEIAGILARSATTAVSAQKSSAKTAAVTTQTTVNGYSGYYTLTVQQNQSGAASGTITFSNYKETSTAVTLSGTMSISGPIGSYPSNGSVGSLGPITISFSNLTGTLGTKSFSLNGSMAYLDDGVSKSLTMSMLLIDNVAQRTYWMKDYAMNMSGNMLTLSGTYFHPFHGYVIMSTLTPLTTSTIDARPTSGQLLFTGSNGTKARLTFTSGGYTIEVDQAGNGVYFPAQ